MAVGKRSFPQKMTVRKHSRLNRCGTEWNDSFVHGQRQLCSGVIGDCDTGTMETTAAARSEDNGKGLNSQQRSVVTAETLLRCFFVANDKNDPSSRIMWTRIWQGTAIASFLFNLLAIVIEGSIASIAAGMIALGIAPIVSLRQAKLLNMDTLRTVQNQLRDEVQRLHKENCTLSLQVQTLEQQVDRLSHKERKLEDMASQQGSTVETFISLIRENRTTTDALKEVVKAEITQSILHALIESDFDASGHFSDDELQILELRMDHLPGIVVNSKLLLEVVSTSDRKLATILELVRHLDMDHLPEEERIFRLDHAELRRKLPRLHDAV